VATKYSDFFVTRCLRIMWTRSGVEVANFNESFHMKTLFLLNFVVKKIVTNIVWQF